MLRGLSWLAGGLLLVACSGDSKGGQPAPDVTDPDACTTDCAAGEVCSAGECHTGCEFSSDCEDGSLCRDGACFVTTCGDGVKEKTEQCDNGARNGDDKSCTSECRDAICGDGHVRDGREECDDGADNADDAACTRACVIATCGDGLLWAGHEECDDGPNNADGGACTTECVLAPAPDPNAASGLGWQQGSHTNDTMPSASWTPSNAANATAQAFQLFADAKCTKPSGKPLALPGVTTKTLQVPVVGEGTYSFQITTSAADGNEVTSACSPALVVDTTPPAPATELGFVETSPHDRLTVHGTWTHSVSDDIGSQSIQLYAGAVCAVTSGMPVDIGSASAEQGAIVTPTGATYSFKVISTDRAGNSAVSACSSSGIQTAGGKPYVAKFNGDFQQTTIQARIDPKNASTIYASLVSGEIHKSVDGGKTWKVQCKSSNIASFGRSYGRIVVSPDGTAYATGHTQFARVEPLNGAECPIAIGSSAAWASYFHSNRLAIDSTGKLYTWGFTGPAGLVSSTNKGVSYDVINTTESLFNSLQVDPFDDKHLVAVFGSHSTDPVGVFNSTDAGVKWAQTDASFEQYQGGVQFNPAAQGWIYLDGGRYSKDGGLSWATDTNFIATEIDEAGTGYRLATTVDSTALLAAPDMTNPVWSSRYVFPGTVADLGVSMVSAVGQTLVVVLSGAMYVSTDGGASFKQIKLAVHDTQLVTSSIVAHGALVYVASGGHVFKSTDGAQNWSDAYAPATALGPDTELHLNPGLVEQLVARPESWNSTYEDRVDVTLDGGVSWSKSDECCYGWSGVLALGATDPSRVFYFGYHPRYSDNGGLSFTESSSSGQLVWDPWPAAFVSPANKNQAFYGDDSGRFYLFDLPTKKDSDVTLRLPFTDPAGMDLVKVGNVWQLRVISTTGKIAVSNDSGATFGLIPGSGGLPAASRRVFVSHPDTPDLIATAALLGNAVAFSPTLGASWVQNTLDSCDVRSLGLTDGELLISCENDPALAIAAP